MKKGILKEDPFITIDSVVGELIKHSVKAGRKGAVNDDFKVGVGFTLYAPLLSHIFISQFLHSTAQLLIAQLCGEHGGDSKSIKFFASAGLDYVSCSPFRVPIARLSAAQANIEAEENKKNQDRPFL